MILTSNRVAHRLTNPVEQCTIYIDVTLVLDPETYDFFSILFYNSMVFRHEEAPHTNQIDLVDSLLSLLNLC